MHKSSNDLKIVIILTLEEKYDFIIIDGEDNFGPEMKWSARES